VVTLHESELTTIGVTPLQWLSAGPVIAPPTAASPLVLGDEPQPSPAAQASAVAAASHTRPGAPVFLAEASIDMDASLGPIPG
jgi:hypothetical protein